jgi:hypothetical protein
MCASVVGANSPVKLIPTFSNFVLGLYTMIEAPVPGDTRLGSFIIAQYRSDGRGVGTNVGTEVGTEVGADDIEHENADVSCMPLETML